MHRRSEQNGTAPVPSAQVILDTLAAPVAVLDQVGTIVATNRAWDEFGQANQSRETSHIGVNYLDVCARATGAMRPAPGRPRRASGRCSRENAPFPWSTRATRLIGTDGFSFAPPA